VVHAATSAHLLIRFLSPPPQDDWSALVAGLPALTLLGLDISDGKPHDTLAAVARAGRLHLPNGRRCDIILTQSGRMEHSMCAVVTWSYEIFTITLIALHFGVTTLSGWRMVCSCITMTWSFTA
jgi:hypothetical protein